MYVYSHTLVLFAFTCIYFHILTDAITHHFSPAKKMPRKNITTLNTDGLTEAREQIEYSIGMLKALEDLVDASDLDTLDVPYFANFSEAIRRVEVFVSGATQAYHQAMLNKHVRETK